MKTINTLLYIMLAGLMTLFASNANAQQSWNFSTMSQADKDACAADANWVLGSDRYCYIKGLDNEPLIANGTELEYTKSLKFTAAEPSAPEEGKAKIRCNYGSKRLELNGTGVILIIPNLKVGQFVEVYCMTGKTNSPRGLSATNLSGTTGFGETSAEELTCTGTVTSDGDVTLTTLEGGMYIYSITVTDEGGEVTPPESDYNDVSQNITKNQVRLTVGSDIKYYNTDEVKITFDKAANTVTVTPISGSWQDVYTKTVSNIDFALAENDDPSGEVTEGEIKIKAYDGWNEAAYIEWELLDGATSYNVYVSGGSLGSEYKKIDYQLVRNYGTYGRADILGLSAGTYSIKVVPVINDTEDESKASYVDNIEVVGHDRIGFAFANGKAPGAYNNDGTLKSGAIVVYVTEENKNTVTSDAIGSSYVGLQGILDGVRVGIKDGDLTKPVDIRIIGQITDPDYLEKGDLLIDMASESKSASYEGLTIEGIGNDAVADGWGIRLKSATSVEIRNLAFMNCDSGEGDNIGLQQNNNYIWVHHCDLFYGNAGSDKDQAKGDGALDCKKSNYVTFSYNHFWDSGKACLLGLSGENDKMYITYHHNWFDHSDSRHPRIRSYSAHIYNNYYDGCAKYGVGATMASSVFVENNYYRNTNRPMMISMQGTDIAHGEGTFSSEDGGIIKSYGNMFAEQSKNFSYVTYREDNVEFDAYEATSRGETVPNSVKTKKGGTSYNNFDTDASIMYDYTPDAASEVVSVVTGKYGAGRLQHGDFQWSFNNSVDDESYDVNTALKEAVTNYKTKLIGIFDGENSESGEQGGETGGETGEGGETGDGGETGGEDNPDVPVITEGTITCSFTEGQPNTNAPSGFFTVAGDKAVKKGDMVIDGTTYSEGLKMNSKGSVSFTPSEDMTMYLYICTSDASESLNINGDDIVSDTATDGGVIISMNVQAGQSYTIKKGKSGETFLYYIKLVPVE